MAGTSSPATPSTTAATSRRSRWVSAAPSTAPAAPRAKSVYDAAVIADPEINYNDYDLDKDGVVDFFMMVFVGLGGNGDSQLNGTPPYDNIWPHSSSLEYSYTQAVTGLKGYVSDDQLTTSKACRNASPTPHTQIFVCAATPATTAASRCPSASVPTTSTLRQPSTRRASIAHEYGHHLGLPDFYSTSYTTYNDWNLMATDFSQHMTIFSKQELGWVVPQFLQPGQTADGHELEGDQERHRPDPLAAPDGTLLHAVGRERRPEHPQRPGIRPQAAATQADRVQPGRRPRHRCPCLVLRPGQRLRLHAGRRPQPRHRAARAGDARGWHDPLP